jgi:hypothetical protein
VPFLVDLHTHSREASSCASQSVEELITRAEMVGLGGVALTDHNSIEGAVKAQRLGRRRNLKVFMGLEVLTEEIGDVLVYGLRENISDAPISFRKLARMAERKGAVMFAAHPFRTHTHNALWGYFEDLGYDWRRGLELPELLRPLTGIEVYNGGCTPEENEMASLFAARFRLRGIAGSDAHGLWRVGWCATDFEFPFETDEQLVQALKMGRFKISRSQTEFDSETERRAHLRSMSQLQGEALATYVEDWMRRKKRKP